MGQLLYLRSSPEPPSPRVPVVTGLPGEPDFSGGIWAQSSMQREEWGGGVPPTFPTADTALQMGHRGHLWIIKNICYSYPIVTKWFLSRECQQVKSSLTVSNKLSYPGWFFHHSQSYAFFLVSTPSLRWAPELQVLLSTSTARYRKRHRAADSGPSACLPALG